MARGVPKSLARMTGRWRIVEMSGWDRDAIDLVEPGFIEFAGDGTGRGIRWKMMDLLPGS